MKSLESMFHNTEKISFLERNDQPVSFERVSKYIQEQKEMYENTEDPIIKKRLRICIFLAIWHDFSDFKKSNLDIQTIQKRQSFYVSIYPFLQTHILNGDHEQEEDTIEYVAREVEKQLHSVYNVNPFEFQTQENTLQALQNVIEHKILSTVFGIYTKEPNILACKREKKEFLEVVNKEIDNVYHKKGAAFSSYIYDVLQEKIRTQGQEKFITTTNIEKFLGIEEEACIKVFKLKLKNIYSKNSLTEEAAYKIERFAQKYIFTDTQTILQFLEKDTSSPQLQPIFDFEKAVYACKTLFLEAFSEKKNTSLYCRDIGVFEKNKSDFFETFRTLKTVLQYLDLTSEQKDKLQPFIDAHPYIVEDLEVLSLYVNETEEEIPVHSNILQAIEYVHNFFERLEIVRNELWNGVECSKDIAIIARKKDYFGCVKMAIENENSEMFSQPSEKIYALAQFLDAKKIDLLDLYEFFQKTPEKVTFLEKIRLVVNIENSRRKDSSEFVSAPIKTLKKMQKPSYDIEDLVMSKIEHASSSFDAIKFALRRWKNRWSKLSFFKKAGLILVICLASISVKNFFSESNVTKVKHDIKKVRPQKVKKANKYFLPPKKDATRMQGFDITNIDKNGKTPEGLELQIEKNIDQNFSYELKSHLQQNFENFFQNKTVENFRDNLKNQKLFVRYFTDTCKQNKKVPIFLNESQKILEVIDVLTQKNKIAIVKAFLRFYVNHILKYSYSNTEHHIKSFGFQCAKKCLEIRDEEAAHIEVFNIPWAAKIQPVLNHLDINNFLLFIQTLRNRDNHLDLLDSNSEMENNEKSFVSVLLKIQNTLFHKEKEKYEELFEKNKEKLYIARNSEEFDEVTALRQKQIEAVCVVGEKYPHFLEKYIQYIIETHTPYTKLKNGQSFFADIHRVLSLVPQIKERTQVLQTLCSIPYSNNIVDFTSVSAKVEEPFVFSDHNYVITPQSIYTLQNSESIEYIKKRVEKKLTKFEAPNYFEIAFYSQIFEEQNKKQIMHFLKNVNFVDQNATEKLQNYTIIQNDKIAYEAKLKGEAYKHGGVLSKYKSAKNGIHKYCVLKNHKGVEDLLFMYLGKVNKEELPNIAKMLVENKYFTLFPNFFDPHNLYELLNSADSDSTEHMAYDFSKLFMRNARIFGSDFHIQNLIHLIKKRKNKGLVYWLQDEILDFATYEYTLKTKNAHSYLLSKLSLDIAKDTSITPHIYKNIIDLSYFLNTKRLTLDSLIKYTKIVKNLFVDEAIFTKSSKNIRKIMKYILYSSSALEKEKCIHTFFINLLKEEHTIDFAILCSDVLSNEGIVEYRLDAEMEENIGINAIFYSTLRICLENKEQLQSLHRVLEKMYRIHTLHKADLYYSFAEGQATYYRYNVEILKKYAKKIADENSYSNTPGNNFRIQIALEEQYNVVKYINFLNGEINSKSVAGKEKQRKIKNFQAQKDFLIDCLLYGESGEAFYYHYITKWKESFTKEFYEMRDQTEKYVLNGGFEKHLDSIKDPDVQKNKEEIMQLFQAHKNVYWKCFLELEKDYETLMEGILTYCKENNLVKRLLTTSWDNGYSNMLTLPPTLLESGNITLGVQRDIPQNGSEIMENNIYDKDIFLSIWHKNANILKETFVHEFMHIIHQDVDAMPYMKEGIVQSATEEILWKTLKLDVFNKNTLLEYGEGAAMGYIFQHFHKKGWKEVYKNYFTDNIQYIKKYGSFEDFYNKVLKTFFYEPKYIHNFAELEKRSGISAFYMALYCNMYKDDIKLLLANTSLSPKKRAYLMEQFLKAKIYRPMEKQKSESEAYSLFVIWRNSKKKIENLAQEYGLEKLLSTPYNESELLYQMLIEDDVESMVHLFANPPGSVSFAQELSVEKQIILQRLFYEMAQPIKTSTPECIKTDKAYSPEYEDLEGSNNHNVLFIICYLIANLLSAGFIIEKYGDKFAKMAAYSSEWKSVKSFERFLVPHENELKSFLHESFYRKTTKHKLIHSAMTNRMMASILGMPLSICGSIGNAMSIKPYQSLKRFIDKMEINEFKNMSPVDIAKEAFLIHQKVYGKNVTEQVINSGIDFFQCYSKVQLSRSSVKYHSLSEYSKLPKGTPVWQDKNASFTFEKYVSLTQLHTFIANNTITDENIEKFLKKNLKKSDLYVKDYTKEKILKVITPKKRSEHFSKYYVPQFKNLVVKYVKMIQECEKNNIKINAKFIKELQHLSGFYLQYS